MKRRIKKNASKRLKGHGWLTFKGVRVPFILNEREVINNGENTKRPSPKK